MEIIFPKSLARPWRWVRFPLPNENWAPWRVWAMLINSCVIASPAEIFGLHSGGGVKFRPELPFINKIPQPAGCGICLGKSAAQSLTVILRGLTRSDFGRVSSSMPCSIFAEIFPVSIAGSSSNTRR